MVCFVMDKINNKLGKQPETARFEEILPGYSVAEPRD
jgi:hypothetical protein